MQGRGGLAGVVERWRARRQRPASWRTLTACATLGLAIAALGLLAHYHSPGTTVTLLLSAVSPYLGLGALVAAALFAIARGLVGWLGLLLAAGLIAAYALVQAPLFTTETVPSGGQEVVAMTANLRLGLADPAAVVRAVRAHHIDVLMLEELTPQERRRLRAAGLDDALAHSVSDPRDGAAGTGLWSRYPITSSQVVHDFGFALVTARLAVPGLDAALTAVALHMVGPYPYSQGWQRDMAHLPGVLKSLPTVAPVLAGGDFNASPDVVQFRRLLTGGYADAAAQAGAGIVRTYPADRFFPPVLAIDHVLTRAAVARSATTVEISGSDHRALVVVVRLATAK